MYRLVVRECLDRPWTDRETDTQGAWLNVGVYSQPGVACGRNPRG